MSEVSFPHPSQQSGFLILPSRSPLLITLRALMLWGVLVSMSPA